MTWLFTTPASPRWWARELDKPAHRCSAPFGWEHHPGHLGSDARSDPNPPARASKSGLVSGTSLRLAPKLGPAQGRSSRVGTAPLGVLLAEPASAYAAMRLRCCRCVPFGSPPRRSPVRAPGEDDLSIMRCLAPAWSGWWAPASRYRCLRIEELSPAALMQSTVFNEHPRVAATSAPLARSLLSTARTCCPAALCGKVRRRPPEAPERRGFGAPDADGGAVGPHHRSWSGASRLRHVLDAGRVAFVRFLARRRPRGPHLLRALAEVLRHGRPCSSPASVFWTAAGDQTPRCATHHVANLGARSAFHRWVSPLRRASSRHGRLGTRPSTASDMLFTRCAARQVRLGLTT
jgi:hypothetical protein